MKKILLSIAVVLLTASVASAQVAPLAAPQVNPQEALAAKKAEVENNIKARREVALQRIDEQIAKAKEAGKPTDKLEEKRQKMLEHMAKREEMLNKRINAQKQRLGNAQK